MGQARFLWLLLPLAAIAELLLFLYDSRRAPELAEWAAVRADVARLKGVSDLVVAAPEWAEPLARAAFGDALMPIADLARADDSAYARAIEVSELGASSSEFGAWPIRERLRVGRFELRVRHNPAPAQILFSFLAHAVPGSLRVDELLPGGERACAFTEHAPSSAGGLHGHLAFRARAIWVRWREIFVGPTILDDQEYRPRRCLWAHPRANGTLRLEFENVPLGRRIHGYAGLSYFLFRDGAHGPVTLSVRVAGETMGEYVHHDEWGWHGFEFDTTRFAGQHADVEFRVHSDDPIDRQFCFYADSR